MIIGKLRISAAMVLDEKRITVDNIADQWKREEYGGVKMWVNDITGDVSLDNPYGEGKSYPHQQQSDSLCRKFPKTRRSVTTIKSLYDGREMEDLFKILDRNSVKQKSKIVTHKK